jgi:undecaprenyl-diphosphatase
MPDRLSRGRLVLGLTAAVMVTGIRTARTQRVGPLEERMFRAVNNRREPVEKPVWLIMQSGSVWAVLLTATVRAWRGRQAEAAAVLVSGGGLWGGAKVVKPLIGRGRPVDHLPFVVVRGRAQRGLGCPSGHSAVAADLALLVGRSASPTSRGLLAVVALSTGLARIYVGAHLPADVATGLALGLMWGIATNSMATADEIRE